MVTKHLKGLKEIHSENFKIRAQFSKLKNCFFLAIKLSVSFQFLPSQKINQYIEVLEKEHFSDDRKSHTIRQFESD
jgi:hypothetical protein